MSALTQAAPTLVEAMSDLQIVDLAIELETAVDFAWSEVADLQNRLAQAEREAHRLVALDATVMQEGVVRRLW